MPMALLTLFEQEVDARPRRSAVAAGDPSLAIPATFGVGGKVQMGNEVISVHVTTVFMVSASINALIDALGVEFDFDGF